MTARSRSRRRPLREFAGRSPFHALIAWLIRAALLGLVVLTVYLVVMNIAVPAVVEGLTRP